MEDEPILDDKDANPEEVIEHQATAQLKQSPAYKAWITRTLSMSYIIELLEKAVLRV